MNLCNVQGSVHRNCNIHPTRCNVTQFIFLETALHVLGGTPTRHQERKQLYLQHLLFVTPFTAICCYRGRVGTGLSVLCCVVGGVCHLQHNTVYIGISAMLYTHLTRMFENAEFQRHK
jgi:hypothetical protein